MHFIKKYKNLVILTLVMLGYNISIVAQESTNVLLRFYTETDILLDFLDYNTLQQATIGTPIEGVEAPSDWINAHLAYNHFFEALGIQQHIVLDNKDALHGLIPYNRYELPMASLPRRAIRKMGGNIIADHFYTVNIAYTKSSRILLDPTPIAYVVPGVVVVIKVFDAKGNIVTHARGSTRAKIREGNLLFADSKLTQKILDLTNQAIDIAIENLNSKP